MQLHLWHLEKRLREHKLQLVVRAPSRYHAKACNKLAGPLWSTVSGSRFSSSMGVKSKHMYEGAVPAGGDMVVLMV